MYIHIYTRAMYVKYVYYMYIQIYINLCYINVCTQICTQIYACGMNILLTTPELHFPPLYSTSYISRCRVDLYTYTYIHYI